jgi:uncharacterized protein (TIGR03663 family)
MSQDRSARKKPRPSVPAAPAPPAVPPSTPREAVRPRTPEIAAPGSAAGEPPAVSLEALVYLGILAVGLAVRLFQLDAWPLTVEEAPTAFAAWLVSLGYRPDTGGMSSLLLYGTALGFLPLSVTDVTARLLPAMLGSALVGLPWLLRDRLGRAGALAAAVLLALSPSFLFFSRSLDGGIVAAAGGLGLVVFALRYVDRPAPVWIYAAAVSLALLVMGGGSGWATIVVLGAALGWLVLRGRPNARWLGFASAIRSARLAGFLAAVMLLVSTGLLTNLGGLQHGLVDPLLVWLGGFLAGAPLPWSYHLTNLLAYEPLLVAFSGLAVAMIIYDRRPRADDQESPPGDGGFIAFLAAWTLISLIWTTIAPAKPASAILHMALPMTLLAGWAIARLVTAMARVSQVASGGVALAWTYFLMLVAVAAVTNPVAIFGGRFETLERQIQVVHAVIVVALFGGLIAMAVWLAKGVGTRGALVSLGLTVLVVLGVFGVHTAWTLAYFPKDTEPLAPEPTTVEMRALAADVAAMARFAGESGAGITLDPALASPTLWYLRDYRHLTLAGVTATAKTPVVIVMKESDARVQPFVAGYEGRKYRLGTVWMPVVSPDASIWNWLTNRVALGPSRVREAVMYISR